MLLLRAVLQTATERRTPFEQIELLAVTGSMYFYVSACGEIEKGRRPVYPWSLQQKALLRLRNTLAQGVWKHEPCVICARCFGGKETSRGSCVSTGP